jgi:hypothetical protein
MKGNWNGSSQKTSNLPHRGNWKLTPSPPSDVNTLLSKRISPVDFRNFFHGVRVDLFWNNPIKTEGNIARAS